MRNITNAVAGVLGARPYKSVRFQKGLVHQNMRGTVIDVISDELVIYPDAYTSRHIFFDMLKDYEVVCGLLKEDSTPEQIKGVIENLSFRDILADRQFLNNMYKLLSDSESVVAEL